MNQQNLLLSILNPTEIPSERHDCASVWKGKSYQAKIGALWDLSYITDDDDYGRLAVLQANLVPVLIHLLDSPCAHMMTPALLTLRNLVFGNIEHTNAVLDAGLIPKISALLHSSNVSLDKLAKSHFDLKPICYNISYSPIRARHKKLHVRSSAILQTEQSITSPR